MGLRAVSTLRATRLWIGVYGFVDSRARFSFATLSFCTFYLLSSVCCLARAEIALATLGAWALFACRAPLYVDDDLITKIKREMASGVISLRVPRLCFLWVCLSLSLYTAHVLCMRARKQNGGGGGCNSGFCSRYVLLD